MPLAPNICTFRIDINLFINSSAAMRLRTKCTVDGAHRRNRILTYERLRFLLSELRDDLNYYNDLNFFKQHNLY